MAEWAAFRHCLQPASRPGITQSLRGGAATAELWFAGGPVRRLAAAAGGRCCVLSWRRALSWSMRCRSMRAPTVCPATAGGGVGRAGGWCQRVQWCKQARRTGFAEQAPHTVRPARLLQATPACMRLSSPTRPPSPSSSLTGANQGEQDGPLGHEHRLAQHGHKGDGGVDRQEPLQHRRGRQQCTGQ